MAKKPSLIGRKLGGGRYEILELFGKGSFAEVYRARQITLQRDVAIKILSESASEDADLVKRFHREAEAIARLDHPHIIKIFDHGSEDGTHYYVMNLLPRTLRALLKPRRPLPLEILLQVARQIAGALNYAQSTIKNFMHRDIKPENVMLDPSHNAILSDFGLVRGDQMARLTIGNLVMGTPIYMSPEQIRGIALDQRSDLYSLGVLLYECATGSPPFLGEIMSICHHHVNDAPPPPKLMNPELPSGVEALILRLLEKAPDRRFQSAAELLSALDALPLELRQPKTSIYSQPTIPVNREGQSESPGWKFPKQFPTPFPSKPKKEQPEGPAKPRKTMWPVYVFVAVSAITFTIALFSYLKKDEPLSKPAATHNPSAAQETTKTKPNTSVPTFAKLQVTSRPVGATILLNGNARKEKAPSLLDSLPPGQYQVQLFLPNHHKYIETVNLEAGRTQTLTGTLAPIPPVPIVEPEVAKVTFTIVSEPPSEIILNGENLGKPANGFLRVALEPGSHKVQFRLPPHQPVTREVTVSSNRENTLEFKWFGQVRVQAFNENGDPEYGAVYFVAHSDTLNTEQLSDGTTWEAPAGEYEVIVKRNGFEMRDAPPRIVVRGGELARVPSIYLRRKMP